VSEDSQSETVRETSLEILDFHFRVRLSFALTPEEKTVFG
jgi:hypothetical protein